MRRGCTALATPLVAGMLLCGCATPGHERLASVGVAELTADGGQVVRVRAESHYFEPSRLVVKVGVPVRMTLENGTLWTGHDFSVFAPEAGLEVNAYVPARKSVTVEFLPEATGDFAFYCNIDDHAEEGARGTLQVVERLPGEVREPSAGH